MMEMVIKNLSSKGSCILAGNIKHCFAGNIKHCFKVKFNPYELIFGKRIYGFSGNDSSLDKNIKQYFRVLKKINFSKLRDIFKIYKFNDINKAIYDFKKGKTLRPLINFE